MAAAGELLKLCSGFSARRGASTRPPLLWSAQSRRRCGPCGPARSASSGGGGRSTRYRRTPGLWPVVG
eukprot:3684617-Lingulodinium_polyedra.AAC.1